MCISADALYIYCPVFISVDFLVHYTSWPCSQFKLYIYQTPIEYPSVCEWQKLSFPLGCTLDRRWLLLEMQHNALLISLSSLLNYRIQMSELLFQFVSAKAEQFACNCYDHGF